MLTHDDRTIKEIHHMYERLPAIGYALALGKPSDGTTATRTSNTAETLLQRAKVYIESPDPQLRRWGAKRRAYHGWVRNVSACSPHRRHQVPVCRHLLKPSDGLEPSTPSLP